MVAGQNFPETTRIGDSAPAKIGKCPRRRTLRRKKVRSETAGQFRRAKKSPAKPTVSSARRKSPERSCLSIAPRAKVLSDLAGRFCFLQKSSAILHVDFFSCKSVRRFRRTLFFADKAPIFLETRHVLATWPPFFSFGVFFSRHAPDFFRNGLYFPDMVPIFFDGRFFLLQKSRFFSFGTFARRKNDDFSLQVTLKLQFALFLTCSDSYGVTDRRGAMFGWRCGVGPRLDARIRFPRLGAALGLRLFR